MRASKTHFEQIPVETVKRIATELPETSVVQAQDEITAPQERWREVAKQVQQETDPKKMTELVQQLLAEFDKRDLSKGSRSVGAECP
jgi:hypothetical protein